MILAPKVSVIIPTHKRAQFLTRAIDSVLSQTYPNVEIVVVDDNAEFPEFRQDTMKAMCKYKGDSRVCYVINDKPMGGGLSRNEGIYVATGEYITFLDDDDVYLADKIMQQLIFTLRHKLDMSLTDVYLCDGNGKMIEYRTRHYIKSWDNNELMRQHILHSLGPTSTFMVKKDIILGMGGFRDVPMGQDFMLMWDMLDHDVKIGYMPGSQIIQYLHNQGRISIGKNKINGENNLYKLKCSKKELLTRSEQRYVDFRHYCVLAVSSKRSAMYFDMIKYALKAFIISPGNTFKQFGITRKTKADAKKAVTPKE